MVKFMIATSTTSQGLNMLVYQYLLLKQALVGKNKLLAVD